MERSSGNETIQCAKLVDELARAWFHAALLRQEETRPRQGQHPARGEREHWGVGGAPGGGGCEIRNGGPGSRLAAHAVSLDMGLAAGVQ